MEPKTIRYSLTHKDVFAFNFRAMTRSRLIQVILILLVIGIGYNGVFAPIPGNHPQPSVAVRIAATIIMELVALVFMAALQSAFLFLLIWTKRFKGLIGEHELTLTDAGMVSKSSNSETTRNWNSLFRIASTRNYLFMYVNETSAMIVPKRYFASAAEAASFEQIIRERAKTD